MRASNEPFFWSMFSAGGMVAAMVIPALIIVTGFLLPAGAVDFDRLHAVLTNPIGRFIVLGVAFLVFAHAAHRLRHTVVDLGVTQLRLQIAVAIYGLALIGVIWTAIVVFT